MLNINKPETDKTTNKGKKPVTFNRVIRIVFGIIMIAVYLGMGILMLMNYFEIRQIIAQLLGALFIVYGIFRAYRQIKGIDYTNR